MTSLHQELSIVYYEAMSKFAQYKRNVLKNSTDSIQAKILQSQAFA